MTRRALLARFGDLAAGAAALLLGAKVANAEPRMRTATKTWDFDEPYTQEWEVSGSGYARASNGPPADWHTVRIVLDREPQIIPMSGKLTNFRCQYEHVPLRRNDCDTHVTSGSPSGDYHVDAGDVLNMRGGYVATVDFTPHLTGRYCLFTPIDANGNPCEWLPMEAGDSICSDGKTRTFWIKRA